MKKKTKLALLGGSCLAVILVYCSGVTYTKYVFDSSIHDAIKNLNTKNLNLEYHKNKRSLFSGEGKLVLYFNAKNFKTIKSEFTANTVFFPFFTNTSLEPLSDDAKKLYENFKIEESRITLSPFEKKLKIASSEYDYGKATVSFLGIDVNTCKIRGANLELTQPNKKTSNVLFSFNADEIDCSQSIGSKKNEDFLKVEKIKLSTSLNNLFDKNFDFQAPEYFSANIEKILINSNGGTFNLKAIDINRHLIDQNTKESMLINLYIDHGAIVSRLNVLGKGDRVLPSEKEGIKTGKYIVKMQGPAFNIPYVKKLYELGFVKQEKDCLLSVVDYVVNLSLIDRDNYTINNPEAIDLKLNKHKTSFTELFNLGFNYD